MNKFDHNKITFMYLQNKRSDFLKMLPFWFVAFAMFLLSGACAQQKAGMAGDKESTDLIDSLLRVMTLEEKIGQMTLFTSHWDVTGPVMRENNLDDIRTGKLGAIFNAHTAEYNTKLQKIAVEESRLGIPLLFGYDVIHGYKTIFPIPLAESASWNLELMEETARIAAREAAAAGLHWTFAPMVDIARDPRWGRISEGSGEDHYLGSLIAEARVRGFQGGDVSDSATLIACVKHFAAYGAAQAGRDYHTVDLSERTLREVYLPPFKAAVDAGVWTVMTSFNELNGVPASGNEYLLTEILRDEWGFDGFVVTDYTSINEMVPHGVVANEYEAGGLALRSGVDMDMQGAVFYTYLDSLLKKGEVTMVQIDQAVRRILRAKVALGLFEDPFKYGDAEKEKEVILSEGHRAVARQMATESMVLLKNESNALPLSKDREMKIALLGPLADNKPDMLGNWHGAGNANDCVTLKEGLEAKLAGTGSSLSFAEGCKISGEDRSGFEAALQAAGLADVVIMALGESERMSGEAASRSELDLPGVQQELFNEVKALDKQVVVVLFNGRPLCIPQLNEQADAILEAWFPGTEAGNAVADILFGEAAPSGRLTATFPVNVGQIPIFYNYKNTGRPFLAEQKYTSKYLDVPNEPLYPFGYGLTYTTFEYGPVKLSKNSIAGGETVKASVTLRNTGSHRGTEIVQLYIRDLVGTVTRPVRELKGFERVTLAPGQEREVSFEITEKDLEFYTLDMSVEAEPGEFEVYIAPHAAHENKATFRLNGGSDNK